MRRLICAFVVCIWHKQVFSWSGLLGQTGLGKQCRTRSDCPSRCSLIRIYITWATSWENLFEPYANNKGADQPAHSRSLISTFVVHYLDSIIIENFKTLASLCSWADRFETYLVGNPKDRFSHDVAASLRTLLDSKSTAVFKVSQSLGFYCDLSRLVRKPTKSLCIRPVWSESSLCAQWTAKDPSFLHADSEDSDQTERMPRLIWVFAGRTCHFVGFVMSGGSFYCDFYFRTSNFRLW